MLTNSVAQKTSTGIIAYQKIQKQREKEDVLFTSYFKTSASVLFYFSAGPISHICIKSLELFLKFSSNKIIGTFIWKCRLYLLLKQVSHYSEHLGLQS